MARADELSLSTRLFLKAYRWRTIDPVPSARLARPLAEAKVALVGTAGLVRPGQEPFDDEVKGGDWSYREIDGSIDVASLLETHRSQSFDRRGIEADRNLGFPLDRLRELEREGVVGALNHRHFSFMGSITAPGRLTSGSAPAVADALAADNVDAVLLVPI